MISNIIALKINAQIISTDSIRKELYGDESIQGDWENIESIMQDKIIDSINQNKSVILDATVAKRPWRLEITQNLILNKNIEWVGWFLKTGLKNCLIWNEKRDRKVPEEIINNFYTALSNSNFGPNLAEGFASIIEIFPNNETKLSIS